MLGLLWFGRGDLPLREASRNGEGACSTLRMQDTVTEGQRDVIKFFRSSVESAVRTCYGSLLWGKPSTSAFLVWPTAAYQFLEVSID
jgi:hypothetical protein